MIQTSKGGNDSLANGFTIPIGFYNLKIIVRIML